MIQLVTNYMGIKLQNPTIVSSSGLTNSIESWMSKNAFKKIDDFRGNLNYSNIENPSQYERSQFMKYFSNVE